MSRLIALCGVPGSGKSEVQRILHQRNNVQPVDDGWPLRDFAIRHCGARLLDVMTQEGKAQVWEFPGGRRMVMREFLGQMGDAIEAILGPEAIPAMAMRALKRERKDFPGFSFGSVRRKQGWFYKAQGGATIVEIVRPGQKNVNDFDLYDRGCVDITITNGGSVEDLEMTVRNTLGPLFA
jgi:hypothetical protein